MFFFWLKMLFSKYIKCVPISKFLLNSGICLIQIRSRRMKEPSKVCQVRMVTSTYEYSNVTDVRHSLPFRVSRLSLTSRRLWNTPRRLNYEWITMSAWYIDCSFCLFNIQRLTFFHMVSVWQSGQNNNVLSKKFFLKYFASFFIQAAFMSVVM